MEWPAHPPLGGGGGVSCLIIYEINCVLVYRPLEIKL